MRGTVRRGAEEAVQIKEKQNRDLPALVWPYTTKPGPLPGQGQSPNQWPDGYPPQESLLEADSARPFLSRRE